MNKNIAVVTVGAAAVIAAALLAACQPPTQQSGPDPKPDGIKPAKIIDAYQLPTGFRNVIEWCDGAGNSNATTSRGSDLAGGQNGGGLPSSGWLIMLKDPRCAQ